MHANPIRSIRIENHYKNWVTERMLKIFAVRMDPEAKIVRVQYDFSMRTKIVLKSPQFELG